VERPSLEWIASMNAYWLEQSDADVPAENHWLSAGEILSLGRMRYPKRRNDWRLGRWTAKRALAACLNLPRDLLALANVEIRAAASGAPEVFLFNQTAPVTISLSHRAGIAMCAVAHPGTGIGCDLEVIEPRSNAFIADYLTAREQALVAQTLDEERALLVNLLWSAKESALKALHVGLRLDTNCMDVSFKNGLRGTPTSLNRTYLLFRWETLIPMGGVPCMSIISGSKSSAAGGDMRTKWYELSSRLSHYTYIFVRSKVRRWTPIWNLGLTAILLKSRGEFATKPWDNCDGPNQHIAPIASGQCQAPTGSGQTGMNDKCLCGVLPADFEFPPRSLLGCWSLFSYCHLHFFQVSTGAFRGRPAMTG